MLRVELDSLSAELDILTELSGHVVSVTGQQETSKLDQVISDLTSDWQLTSQQCTARLQLVDSALKQSTVFSDQLMVCYQPLCSLVLLFLHPQPLYRHPLLWFINLCLNTFWLSQLFVPYAIVLFICLFIC